MEFTLTITGASKEELAKLLAALGEAPAEVKVNPPKVEEVKAAEPEAVAPFTDADSGDLPFPAAEQHTEEDIRSAGRALAAIGQGAAVREVLQKHGVNLVSALKPEDYEAVWEELAQLCQEVQKNG